MDIKKSNRSRQQRDRGPALLTAERHRAQAAHLRKVATKLSATAEINDTLADLARQYEQLAEQAETAGNAPNAQGNPACPRHTAGAANLSAEPTGLLPVGSSSALPKAVAAVRRSPGSRRDIAGAPFEAAPSLTTEQF